MGATITTPLVPRRHRRQHLPEAHKDFFLLTSSFITHTFFHVIEPQNPEICGSEGLSCKSEIMKEII
jgi:hypothetical protein